MVSRTKERALDPLFWCLRYPPWSHRHKGLWSVNMLAEERRCKRHPGATFIHAALRLCAPLPAALPELQSSQILRAAWLRPQPAAQPHSRRVMPEHMCVSSSMHVWGELRPALGTFVEKNDGFGENTPPLHRVAGRV